jgi:hypothetical protein
MLRQPLCVINVQLQILYEQGNKMEECECFQKSIERYDKIKSKGLKRLFLLSFFTGFKGKK